MKQGHVHVCICTFGVLVGGGAWDLDKRESRSTRALDELAVEGIVGWEREEAEERGGAPIEEEAELAEMGGASGMDTGCIWNKLLCIIYMHNKN